MDLNFKKGIFYGTVNVDNNKQTYGYTFKHKYSNSNRKWCKWYVVLKFLLYHTPYGGVTKERTLKFANNTCTLSGNGTTMPKSNHDIFSALKNCNIINYKCINGETLWFADIDKATELLGKAK